MQRTVEQLDVWAIFKLGLYERIQNSKSSFEKIVDIHAARSKLFLYKLSKHEHIFIFHIILQRLWGEILEYFNFASERATSKCIPKQMNCFNEIVILIQEMSLWLMVRFESKDTQIFWNIAAKNTFFLFSKGKNIWKIDEKKRNLRWMQLYGYHLLNRLHVVRIVMKTTKMKIPTAELYERGIIKRRSRIQIRFPLFFSVYIQQRRGNQMVAFVCVSACYAQYRSYAWNDRTQLHFNAFDIHFPSAFGSECNAIQYANWKTEKRVLKTGAY